MEGLRAMPDNIYLTGGAGNPYNGLYAEASPERGIPNIYDPM